jgi:glucokinase
MPASIHPPHDVEYYPDGPRLLADIGGTNARFALEHGPGRIDMVRVLRGADYAAFSDAVEAYLHDAGHPAVQHAAVAIANPVQGDWIRMTNHHWTFSIDEVRRRLGFDTLLVINDFTALAMSLPHLGHEQCVQIGGPVQDATTSLGVIGLVGAGTGLGVGGLIPCDGRWTALGSEGGHASFSPNDMRELEVLQFAWKRFPHVSAERLVSGTGIELIYEALAARSHAAQATLGVSEVVKRALDGSDALCQETVECFCGMLGTVASNVALTLGTLGGLYIGGGIVPRLGDYFARSPFRARFEAKGRFSDYLQQIQTYVITAPYPAFVGVAVILAEHLGRDHAAPAALGQMHVAEARRGMRAEN